MKKQTSLLPLVTALYSLLLAASARSLGLIFQRSTSARCLSKMVHTRLWMGLMAIAMLTNVAQAQTILNSGATINVSMTQGQSFSQNFEGTGTQDNVYTVVGTLPPGISHSTIAKSPPATNGHELVLSGTPTSAGSYSATVNVSATFFSVPILYSTTINVTVVAAPPSANALSQSVLKNSSNNVLTPVTSGSVTSMALASTPSHGTAAVSGLTIVYTPANGYSGSDTFSYQATGPGGTSTAATISINVRESAPNLSSSSVKVSANSTANLISPAIEGDASSLNIISSPAHGTVSVSGLSLTYTPNKDFIGSDQIILQAQGAGGLSNSATISINVVNDVPTVNPSTMSANANGGSVTITPEIIGSASAIVVRTAPSHGVATVNGLTISYTPERGFVGVDTLSVVANGAGGSSAPVVISINVQALTPVLSASNVQVVANSVANSIVPKIVGLATTLNVLSAASHGIVTVRGTELLYTPTAAYVGSDAVSITATGPGGVSNTVRIEIEVKALDASANSVTVQANSTANSLPVLALAGAMGLTVNAQAAHGVLTVNGLTLSYTPTSNYVGPDSVSYALQGSNGSFASSTITIAVVAAAPVAKNMNLSVETGRSASVDLASVVTGPVFSGVSISINSQPAHGVASLSGSRVTYTPAPGYVGSDSLSFTATAIGGVSNVAQLLITVVPRPDPSKDAGVLAMTTASAAAVRHFEQTQIEHFNGRMLALASQASSSKNTEGNAENSAENSAENKDKKTECGAVALWVSGLNSVGSYRSANGLKYTTMGFSAGGDRCFGGGQTHLGFGLGYARDHSEFERNPSFMTATANTAASYLTTQLFPSLRVSFMLGVNQIEDRFGRQDSNDLSLAFGQWKGTQMISSGAVSSDLNVSYVKLTPYVRLDMTRMRLDPFSETGGGAYLLHYHEQTMLSQRSTVGFNSEMKVATPWGELIPRLKMEYQRDFARRDSLKINYIDAPDAIYLIPGNDVDRRFLLISLGADMMWKNGIVTIFNYTHSDANGGNKANRFNVRFSYQY